MAAPDFFENFLLHNGLKALHPQENPLIVPLSRQRRHRQADTPQAAYLRLWGRGGLTASPPVGAAYAPASVSPHTMPEKSAPCPERTRSMRTFLGRYSLSFSPFLTKIKLFRVLSALFHPLQCFI